MAGVCLWIAFKGWGGLSYNHQAAKKPVSAATGKIAIIIDDCGYSGAIIDKFTNINAPLTFSVLPHLLFSQTVIDRANAHGKQIMLHLPLQSPSKENVEKNTILESMSDAEIMQTTQNALLAVPGALGLNNHQGASATTDRRIMRVVMKSLADKKMFFVDSMTTPASIGCETAREFGVATVENRLFLDNYNNVPYIEGQLRKAIKLAHNRSIIVIGHARPDTAKAISNMLEEIRRAGIELVFVSQIVG